MSSVKEGENKKLVEVDDRSPDRGSRGGWGTIVAI